MNRKTKVLVFRWIKPHHLIVLMVLCMTFAIFAGYAISVSDNHVAALFPYISDAGAKPPASCVFGLLLNIGGMFAFIIIYLRHVQYETFHAREIVRLYVVNDITMFLGFCAALGALFVANFQDVNVITMHVIGALVLFVVGNIYCWLQDYLSYKADASRCILYTRYTLTVISTLMFVVTTVGSSEAGKMLAKTNLTSWDNTMHYKKDMPVSYSINSFNFCST